MVLVDTSIWVRFLAGKDPYAAKLCKLLSSDEVAAHDLVAGELLVGDRGGRQELLAAYHRIYKSATVPHGEVMEFVRRRKLNGRGIGWVDVHLLASGLVSRIRLWTADSRLEAIASELGIAYQLR